MEGNPKDMSVETWRESVEQGVGRLLVLMGRDLTDPAVQGTPRRVREFYESLLIKEIPKITTFDAKGYSHMVVESRIRFYSLCEHHLLPFFGTAHIGYLPAKRMVGLSKLARIVQYFSMTMTTQEYLTDSIMRFVVDQLEPVGAGVILQAEHLCMSMRGVCQPGHQTTTSALHGKFFEPQIREEFFRLCVNS